MRPNMHIWPNMYFCCSGWGATEYGDFSTNTLQETEMKIVDSSECSKETKQAERPDDDLIVCAERVQNGPGKVYQELNVLVLCIK